MTAEQALERHGIAGGEVIALARKAAVDWYAARGRALKPDLLEEATGYLVIQALVEIRRFDPSRTSDSARTWLYWKVRRRVPDWLRYGRATAGLGDVRNGRSGRECLTTTGELPVREDAVLVDGDDLEQAVEQFAEGLSERSAWTLRHLMSASARGDEGWAARHGFTDADAERLRADLADELLPLLPAHLRVQVSAVLLDDRGLFEEWEMAELERAA